MTLPEITLLLTSTPKRTLGGATPMSNAEIDAYTSWYRGLGNRERLELARRGEL